MEPPPLSTSSERENELRDELGIPVDLSDWVPKSELAEWVAETVDGLNWNNPELIETLQRYPGFEPKAVLGSLVLAYLTGVFGAEDIVRSCSRDPDFRPVRPQLPPRAADFSTFRKLNRGVLSLVLVQVLSQALRSQFVEGESIGAFPPGVRRLIVQNALERLNVARHMDRSAEV